MIAAIHAQPATPCKALQPAGTLPLRPVPDPVRPAAEAASAPVAAQAMTRADQRQRCSAAWNRGVGGDHKPVYERECVDRAFPASGIDIGAEHRLHSHHGDRRCPHHDAAVPVGQPGQPAGEQPPPLAPQVGKQRQQHDREHQQDIEEPQVRGVEIDPARRPRPVQQQPSGDRRDVRESEPIPPVRLVKVRVGEASEVEHRRDQHH